MLSFAATISGLVFKAVSPNLPSNYVVFVISQIYVMILRSVPLRNVITLRNVIFSMLLYRNDHTKPIGECNLRCVNGHVQP